MMQICLTTSPLSSSDALSRALAAGAVSVLIVPANDEDLTAPAVLPIVKAVQNAGAAALIHGNAELARTVRADGVHLTWRADLVDMFEETRSILGGSAIIGVDAGVSRHDAMTLGEAGADYIAFGAGSGGDEAIEMRNELVAWWGEIFEIPVVAFDVESALELQDLMTFGADFACISLDSFLADEDAFTALLAAPSTATVA